MAIIVTCPGCHKSFSVKDEFGGRKGPCPKCKTIITIPMPDKKVTVHGGDAFETGGTNAKGEFVLKPIKRRENIFRPKTFAIVTGSALLLFLLTWLLGGILQKFPIAAYVGLILVTPPLVYAPYFFLRDTEAIEDLSKSELITRTILCSVIYLAFWTVYLFFAPALVNVFDSLFSYMTWPFAAIPLLILGGIFASFFFDLETVDGYVHTIFYVGVTALLFWTAGLSLMPADENTSPALEQANAAAVSAADSTPAADEATPEKGKKGKKDKKNKKSSKAQAAEEPAPPVKMNKGKPVDPRSK
ncbi:MAG: zinc-ribbon domain-containing protein [Thermoguttaceae bacterium]|nr:zinc-ribbon domain-containing protein [Thermoguttaceae bacterium]